METVENAIVPVVGDINTSGKDPITGRFLPGHKLAHGNPWNNQISKLRKALFDSVTEGDVKDVIGSMLDKAKKGDVKAATLVLSYLIGKPVQPIDANITGTALSPEQMRERLDQILGIR